MPNQKVKDLVFPLAGQAARWSFQNQEPYSTPDILNCWPVDSEKERTRGGSRPGLGKASYTQLGSGNPIRNLNTVTWISYNGPLVDEDSFKGNAVSAGWSTASWGSLAAPAILPDDFADVAYGATAAGLVRAAQSPFDTTLPWQVDLFVVPYQATHWGKYTIFGKMNDSSPVATTDGFAAEITLTGTTGLYSGTLTVYSGGTPTAYSFSTASTGQADAGYFSVLYTPSSTNVKVYWLGTQILSQNITLGGSAGNRVGFGMNCTVSGGINLVDLWRFTRSATGGEAVRRRDLVATSNGTLYKENFGWGLSTVSVNATLASDRTIQSAEFAQKLYYADTGPALRRSAAAAGVVVAGVLDDSGVSDWTALGIDTDDHMVQISAGAGLTGGFTDGTYKITTIHATDGLTLTGASGGATSCNYRVIRAPKVYDPSAATLVMVTPTAGFLPLGCDAVCQWRGRMVWAGDPDAPHAFYASAAGDPLDYDYSVAATDGGRAFAGTSSNGYLVGGPINALIPHSDDYLLIGTDTTLWIMRGDPALGGSLDNLSKIAGVVHRDAHCRGPNGEIYFLSRDGLYMVLPGGSNYPTSLSREVLPKELRDLSKVTQNVCLAYDPRFRLIHIYVTASYGQGLSHWVFNMQGKGFFKMRLQNAHEPYVVHAYAGNTPEDSAVLLGCRDGYVRRHRYAHENDDGSSITNHVYFGPIRLGDSYRFGLLKELICELGADSGTVTWNVYVGDGGEAAYNASSFATGSFSTAGLNFKVYPRGRGGSAFVKLSGSGTRKWMLERLTVMTEALGAQRLR